MLLLIPNYVRKTLLILSITLAVLAATVVFIQTGHSDAQAASKQTAIETAVVEATNAERVAHHLEPLTWNADLYRAATNKAADMFDEQYFDHISPTGTTPWQFIRPEYRYIEAGENLSIDFQDPLKSVPAWMASDSHRANILNAHYEDIAIVVTEGAIHGKRTTIVVQMFGKPDILQR